MNEVKQIKIGKYTVGLVGLKEALIHMAEAYAEQPDDVVAEELLSRLSKKNYIADKVKKDYKRALVREFRKSLGQPFENEISEGLEIKILGEGCTVCNGLEDAVREVLSEMSLKADLEHIRDADQIARYKVKGTPALIINGKVMSIGSPPLKKDIIKWVQEIGIQRSPGGTMDKPVLIKNITFSKPHNLNELVDYEEGRVVSRTFAQNSHLSLTLFAFDAGEEISTHTAPGDAMVQVLDGEAVVNIDGEEMIVVTGQVVVMPANIPHSVKAIKSFKMLLTVVRSSKNHGGS